ncbi:hypothetical protein BpHYR1_039729 [Brachionus plicatilis]|uniref:Uncharacterized protein n=1 Tax=Brachionus plicatilis TaxID=10195 RepID=A0A3M7T5V1_BRAPC|nr:hypothetical protein BpHYR1_039729 [Brachionus plicatilis]
MFKKNILTSEKGFTFQNKIFVFQSKLISGLKLEEKHVYFTRNSPVIKQNETQLKKFQARKLSFILCQNYKIQLEDNQTKSKNSVVPIGTGCVRDSYDGASEQSTTAIFAAAAVATATTLSAISTSDRPTETPSTTNSRTYVSWAQYASERRSSLQRRKLEITKKLEKASNAANNRKDCTQFQQKPRTDSEKTTEIQSKNQTSDKIAMNFLKDLNPDQDDQVLEINEISEALLQYIYTNGITDATNLSPYDSAQSYLLKKESMKRKREEKINYVLTHRWDPIQIGSVLTNRKQDYGEYVTYRIRLIILDNEANLILKLRDAKKTSLVEKIKIIQKEIEICDSKIYLKEGLPNDTHLAIVGLSVIGVLFHLLGLILIVVGFCGYSRGSLYYYHSAGESLITSAFVNLLCLVAFLLLVSSEVEHRYEFDFDEIVNEYRIWKLN